MHMQVEDVPFAKMEITSFKRAGQGWLALLTGDIQGLARALSRSLQ